MNYQDVIQGFKMLKKEQLEQLREALSLTMPIDMLMFCVEHYKTQEKRDPCLDELYMLDRLSETLEEQVGTLALTDMLTNDEFVAETYADLLKKRKALNPYASYPCTLYEATKVATAYLLRAGMKNQAIGASILPEQIDRLVTAPSADCVTVPDSPFRLRPPVYGKGAGKNLLVLVGHDSNEPSLVFGKRFEDAVTKTELKNLLIGVYTVRESGILHTLLEAFNGVNINLAAFSAWQSSVPMTVLTKQYGGARILRTDEARIAPTLNLLREHGMSPVIFGEVTNNGSFSFLRGGSGACISINAQFMRLLFHYKSLRAELADEYALSADKIATTPVFDTKNDEEEAAVAANYTIGIGNTLCAAASSTPDSAYFKTALYTALAPVLTLAACGADYLNQQCSIGLQFPAACDKPDVAGNVLSTVLGVYRAQTELSLLADGISVHTSNDATSPSVTVFARAEVSPTASRFCTDGGYVYCLTPDFKESGLPDFRTLRSMLQHLKDVAHTEACVSASVLVNESITDGILKMNGDYICKITDSRVASESAIPIAVLIESRKPLGYREIGRTEAVIPPVSAPESDSYEGLGADSNSFEK